jgi:Domain of unknown function (DUF4326)
VDSEQYPNQSMSVEQARDSKHKHKHNKEKKHKSKHSHKRKREAEKEVKQKKPRVVNNGPACLRCKSRDHYADTCQRPPLVLTAPCEPVEEAPDGQIALARNIKINGTCNKETGQLNDPTVVYCGRNVNMGGWRLKESVFCNRFLYDNVAAYEAYLAHTPELMALLPNLRGRVLGCWCKPKECHTDVLVRRVNEMYDGQ